jgi:hypothetical protein
MPIAFGALRTQPIHSWSTMFRCVVEDGIGGVDAEVVRLSPQVRSRTLVFIDPFNPLERSTVAGLTSVDLAAGAAAFGTKVVYWYGFDEETEREWAWRSLSDVVDASVPRFFAETGRPHARAPSLLEEGMRGCGVVCLNCSVAAKGAATTAAAELVEMNGDASPAHSDAKRASPRRDAPRNSCLTSYARSLDAAAGRTSSRQSRTRGSDPAAMSGSERACLYGKYEAR